MVMSIDRIVVTELSRYHSGNIAASPQSVSDKRCFIIILSPPEIMRKHLDPMIFLPYSVPYRANPYVGKMSSVRDVVTESS